MSIELGWEDLKRKSPPNTKWGFIKNKEIDYLTSIIFLTNDLLKSPAKLLTSNL